MSQVDEHGKTNEMAEIMNRGEQDVQLKKFFLMHEDVSEIIRLSQKCLSQEAYAKVFHIIECEYHCIIDMGIGEEPGLEGQNYYGKNNDVISETPLLFPDDDI